MNLIGDIAGRRHAPSRSQGALGDSTASDVAVLVGLVIHYELVAINSACSIRGILEIASIAKRLRIYRLWVVPAKVKLFEQFLLFLSLLLYDLASTKVRLKLPRANGGLLQR